MKQVISFLFIVLAAIALLIIINTKGEKARPVPIEKNQYQPTAQTKNFSVIPAQAKVFTNKHGITVTRKTPKKEVNAPKEEKKRENNKAISESGYSEESSSAGVAASVKTGKPASASIKIDKASTKEESSESDRQGIIIY